MQNKENREKSAKRLKKFVDGVKTKVKNAWNAVKKAFNGDIDRSMKLPANYKETEAEEFRRAYKYKQETSGSY